MSQGVFSSCFETAQITPLLKKVGLDKDDPAKYRPISDLNILSKFLEKLLLVRIQHHVTSSPNFNPHRSADRTYQSTETAFILTVDDILHSVDQGSSSVLVSLDLSAAFDTINHFILLNRLEKSFGIHGLALSWFQSYLYPAKSVGSYRPFEVTQFHLHCRGTAKFSPRTSAFFSLLQPRDERYISEC